MNDSDKIAYTKRLIPPEDGNSENEIADEDIAAYLLKAKSAILNRRYATMPERPIFPRRYEVLQCELAARYYLRRGAEGEIMHSEDGTSRTYETVNDNDLLSVVVPVMRCI